MLPVMEYRPAERTEHIPSSFLREIFAIIADPNVISFAGGLPNATLFPVDAFKKATDQALDEAPDVALQYGATNGLPELRTIIAESYQKKDGLNITADNILITTGSQQALDLVGKVFASEDTVVAVEDPTYLAAIQAFSLYRPRFVPVPLTENGPDVRALKTMLEKEKPSFFYTIPNFQNPTGITCPASVRKEIAGLCTQAGTVIIEDDPYGEIRFGGERQPTYATYTDNVVLTGSFSKIVAPGLRLGWMVIQDEELMKLFEKVKQAADLHTSTFVQHVVYNYYRNNDSDAHVNKIAAAYKDQKEFFCTALYDTFGNTVTCTDPEGGMFAWATFPEHIDTAKLFPIAVEEGIAFVPGESFFIGEPKRNTMRLNYTNASKEDVIEGMQRLKKALERYGT